MGKLLRQASRQHRPVVLAVGDGWGLRQSLDHVLGQHYEVLSVSDGRAALAVAGSRHLDAVLLDVLVAGAEGLGLLGSLRAIHPDVAVILISGANDVPRALGGMDPGAYAHLTRPFAAERLRATLARAIEPGRTSRRHALLIGNDAAVLAAFATMLSRFVGVITAPPELDQLPDAAGEMPLLVLYDSDSAPEPTVDFVHSLRARFAEAAFIILASDVDRLGVLPDRATLGPDQLVAKPFRLEDVLHRMARFVPALSPLSMFGTRLGVRVTRLIEYVARMHREPLQARELARAVNLSVGRLAHLVRDRLGVALMEYVTRFRVEVARHLIAVTDLTLEEVADRAGFATASHLSRAFLHHTGHRPGEYRRLIRAFRREPGGDLGWPAPALGRRWAPARQDPERAMP